MRNQTGKNVVKLYAATCIIYVVGFFGLGVLCAWSYIVSHYQLIAL